MSQIKVAGQDVGQQKCDQQAPCEDAATLLALLEHSSDGIFIVDVEPEEAGSPGHGAALWPVPDFRFVAANRAAREMLSIATGSVGGLRLRDCLNAGSAGTIWLHLSRCQQQRQPIECEVSFDRSAGKTGSRSTGSRQIAIRLKPVEGLDSRICKIIGLCYDITERRRVEAEARLLQTVTLAIAQAEDFQSALSVALRHCCEATGWDFGEAWIPSPDAGALKCSPAWYSRHSPQNNKKTGDRARGRTWENGRPSAVDKFRKISEALTFAPGVGLPGRVWLTKQPEWEPHVAAQPETVIVRAQVAAECGFGAGLAIPITAGDRVLAVLVFFMLEPREQDRRLVELVSAVAAQLGELMQRKQAEAALQESQRKLAHLIDSLPGIVFSCANDPEWSLRYLSEGVVALTGYKAAELVGKSRLLSYNCITHPEDLPKVLQAIEAAIASKQPYVVEYRIRTKSGQEKWLWEKGSGVFDSTGTAVGIEGFITDITGRVQAEVALRQAEQKYRSIFENAVEGIFQTTPDGRYLTANPMLARIYGYDSPAELISTLTDIQRQLYADPNRRLQFMRLLQEDDAVWDFESQVYRKDGSVIWISENARAIRDARGELLGYEGTVADITGRKQAEIELHKRDRLLSGAAEAMNHLLTDTNHRSAVSKALATLGPAAGADRVCIWECHAGAGTGKPTASLEFEWVRDGNDLMGMVSWLLPAFPPAGETSDWELGKGFSYPQCPVPGAKEAVPDSMLALLSAGLPVSGCVPCGYGSISVLLVPVRLENEFWGYISFEDRLAERRWHKSEESILVALAASIGGALERHRTEEKIRHQACHDRLTGLPNRQVLDSRLPVAIEGTRLRENLLAVIFLDLDRFKIINDTLGHPVGDRLLQNAALRLRSCLREGDTIVRWGGDEFILLLPHLSSAEDAAQIAQRIIETLAPAFDIEGHQLYVTSSIGIALYPPDGKDAETLIKNADTALYRAKEQGRNNYQLYSPEMNSGGTELLILDNSLHRALERGEFQVYYQPQFDTDTGLITRMEALLRWAHPERGLISPETFIPLAEENGLIVPLGKWVLQTACAQNKAWIDAGLALVRVAVNLSARQFQQPDLVEMVAQVLQETGLEPQYLELEITETTAMRDVEFTRSTIDLLQRMGISISMDDFGIGYASLSYLKKFPFHTLKIDRAFVRDMTASPTDAAIVKAIIALGAALDLSVVAEGIETEAQRDLLRSLQCREMQGYLFSPPLTAAEATHILSAPSGHLHENFTLRR
ncbi:EAL domain-containing protein [Kamptonema formosum]|uniref:EAL domain-containing protein n=1 Tax=Kamptonema formosum TaxID=331992 RepID=UPI00036B073D|nr:EAL domain-containing protein [Oscillatoria sp. PCC 10802]